MVLVHGNEMEILFEIQLTLYVYLSLPELTHFLHHTDRWRHNSSTILSFVLCPTNVPLCDHSPQTVGAGFYSVFYCWLMILDTRSE